VFDLTDDDPDTDPDVIIRTAVDDLDDAATSAYRGALQLGDARNTIASLSYLPAPADTTKPARGIGSGAGR
jgi:hypothetical protein